MEAEPSSARALWEALEPLHAVVYFSSGPAEAAKSLGLRGWWMGYFAGRAAPLGPIGPAPVTAMFFGFAPRMVARAIPDAWRYCPPERVLEVRIASAAEALRAALLEGEGESRRMQELSELADLLEDAVGGCRYEGRPLAAAWAAVAAPDEPFARLWLALTVLREHRGDGHVLAAVTAGLGGLETTITHVATGEVSREVVQPNRGWTDGEWEEALERLQGRGLLDHTGQLTSLGSTLRRDIEDVTDRLASGPLERLGPSGVQRVMEIGAPLSRSVIDAGVVPVPNPIGAPRPGQP